MGDGGGVNIPDLAAKQIDLLLERASEDLREEIGRLRARGAWHPVHGDRRQEIVFIGDREKMNIPAMVGALEDCLLTDREMEAADLRSHQPQIHD